jgi:translocator protein
MIMNTMWKNDTLRQLVVIVTFIGTLLVNYLSNALPLNGVTAAEVSDALYTYFTPANFAFSIWGLIYLGLTGFVVYQALPAQRDNPMMRRIGYPFALTSVLNAVWLFAWHYGNFVLSVVVMLALLATLLTIYVRLDLGLPAAKRRLDFSNWADRWLVHIPFSLYTAWMTVATVANVAGTLVYYEWGGWGISGPVWSVIMMGVATLITGVVLIFRRNLPHGGVVVWALVAISVGQTAVPLVSNAAIIYAVVVAALALIGWYRTRPQQQQEVGYQPQAT